MTFLWRYVMVGAALVAACLLLAACGEGEEEEADGLATATPAAATEVAASTETATPEGEGEAGGTATATEVAGPTETPTQEGEEEAGGPTAATPAAPTEVTAPTEAPTQEEEGEEVTPPDLEEALEEYLERIEDVLDGHDEELDEAKDVCEEAWEEEELADAIEAALGCKAELVPILEQVLAEVGNIEPPVEVQSAHRALVAAGADVVVAVQGLVERLQDVETASDFATLVGEVVPTFFAFDGACLELQELADEVGIDIDLGCE
jgi:hypothetical protein